MKKLRAPRRYIHIIESGNDDRMWHVTDKL